MRLGKLAAGASSLDLSVAVLASMDSDNRFSGVIGEVSGSERVLVSPVGCSGVKNE